MREKWVSRTMTKCKIQVNLSKDAKISQNSKLIDHHSGKRSHLIPKTRPQEPVSPVQYNRTHGHDKQMLNIVQIDLKLSNTVEMWHREC